MARTRCLLATLGRLQTQVDDLGLVMTHVQMRVWARYHDKLSLLGQIRDRRTCLERLLGGLTTEMRLRGAGLGGEHGRWLRTPPLRQE